VPDEQTAPWVRRGCTARCHVRALELLFNCASTILPDPADRRKGASPSRPSAHRRCTAATPGTVLSIGMIAAMTALAAKTRCRFPEPGEAICARFGGGSGPRRGCRRGQCLRDAPDLPARWDRSPRRARLAMGERLASPSLCRILEPMSHTLTEHAHSQDVGRLPDRGEVGHLFGGVRSGRMARYAVDAPTLVHIVDQDLSIHPSRQLVAPSSIRTESLELLLRDVRDGKRSDREAMACHERMIQLKMRLLGDRVSRRTAWQLAREREWASLREAEYLAVASCRPTRSPRLIQTWLARQTASSESPLSASSSPPGDDQQALTRRAPGRRRCDSARDTRLARSPIVSGHPSLPATKVRSLRRPLELAG